MNRSRKGFTLVEIMIAAVLASLVTLSAVAAVKIVTRGREKVERYSEVSSELRYIAESMKKDLRNISRGSLSKKFVGELVATDAGIVPSLTFYTTRWQNVRKGEPEGDVYEVQYTIGVQNGKNVMLRRLWPDPNDQLGPSGVVSVLSDNIAGFEVKYLDDKEWRNDWPEDIGKDCTIMTISLAAQVPGESQKIVKSFMMSFPRLGTAAAQTGGTTTATTTTAMPAATTGSAAGGAVTGRSQGAGGGRAMGAGGRGGRGQNAEGGGENGGRGQGGQAGRPGERGRQGDNGQNPPPPGGPRGPGGPDVQGGQTPGGQTPDSQTPGSQAPGGQGRRRQGGQGTGASGGTGGGTGSGGGGGGGR